MNYNPPNTRERVAARRQRKTQGAVATRPGARRVLLAWLISGRLVAAVGFLICIGALGYVLSSPRFAVWNLTVEGNNALSVNDVVALSELRGRPIWFVDSEVVVERLLTSAYVESAAIELALPDTAVVRIVERRPEVRWLAGGIQYLVDARGQVLGPAQEPAETDVLVIIDNSHLQLAPNDRIDSDALGLARVLALRLPNELSLTPAEIGWDIALGVYVRSPDGQLIVFGRSDDLERKLAVLDFLITDQTAFTYLDLRSSNPFYQNATGSSQ
ncbi:MAG: FtsQ-type POTRA domain-containing protein [Oscillochloris sp.]|nr:FtsQ-type POTRA domain-containing protein [Oscillochloris sp.]